MGKGDRRKSNKMRQRASQEHYKARKARPKAPADKKPKAAPKAEPPPQEEHAAVVKREAPEPAADEPAAEADAATSDE